MNIEIIKTFKIPFGTQFEYKKLDAVTVTALAIWLVEAIHNPNVPPLVLKDTSFIWRTNNVGDEPVIFVEGLKTPVTLKHARELVDEIEKLANNDHLLDDTYPSWYDHAAEQGELPGGYQVAMFTKTLLSYVSLSRNKVPVLPVALQIHGDNEYYTIVKGQRKEGEIFYTFG